MGSPWLQAQGVPPIYALAGGVMLGGVLQLAIQLPALRAIGCLPRIGLSPRALMAAWRYEGVRRVMRQMAPVLLGVSVAPVSLLINTRIATGVGVGAVSWLSFADRLMEFPTALLGVALGVVLLPQLAAAQARGDAAEYSSMLDWGLRMVMLLTLPCAVALVVFPQPLVAVLFHYGAFSAHDVQQTTRALMGYGVGLLGIVAIKVLAPAYYARMDVRTPVRIAIVVLVITQLLNLLLVPRLGHVGLTLSIGLGACINAAWLLTGLLRKGLFRANAGWAAFLARLLIANVAMALLLAWLAVKVDWIGLQAQWPLRVGWMAVSLVGAAALYFAALAAAGLRWRHFSRKA